MRRTKVTHHASKRFNERVNIDKISDQQELTRRAFRKGLRIRAFKNPLYDYLCKKSVDGGHYQIRVYKDNIFIFNTKSSRGSGRGDVRLVTMYPVPEEFLPIDNFRAQVAVDGNPVRCILALYGQDGSTIGYICEGDGLTDDIALAIEFRCEQRANNYIKNNHFIALMKKQGYKVVVIPE